MCLMGGAYYGSIVLLQVSMMAGMKSSYNKRLSFGNPLSQQAASRSTRYRCKRKRSFKASILELDVSTNDTISNDETESNDDEIESNDDELEAENQAFDDGDPCLNKDLESLHCSDALEGDLKVI